MDLFPFDDDYVRRLRQGDRETEEHFEAYFRELLLIKLRRRLARPDAIEDVRQEVLLRVIAKLDDLRDGRKLGAFVNSFCQHVLSERYRDDAKALRTDHVPEPVPAPNPERELVKEETRARVRRVLCRLRPERDAEILRALFINDKDKDEICREFGIDRNYLRVLVYRAKEKFREEFGRKSTPPFVVTMGGQSSLSI